MPTTPDPRAVLTGPLPADDLPVDALRTRVEQHLDALYPDADRSALADELLRIMGLPLPGVVPQAFANLWDQSDTFVITYANTINDGGTPLHRLHDFLRARLGDLVSGVHLLPFFPYSSDDGFAVTDYDRVDPAVGTWDDITALSRDYRVMADLVINHCSSEHPWFVNYTEGRDPGRGWFIEADPDTNLGRVVRPRTSPLLRPTTTVDGDRHVWCTFSHDQPDLNFANPEVLLAFARIVRRYLDAGVSVFRLDAIAFLWKQAGTDCLNLPQTHEVVRLLRTLVEHRDPNALIITETNIPNRQNLSYFGNANEAHLVYNFSLPPLLVHALVTGNAKHLKSWMMAMPPAQHGTTFLNFIASHDGIGLRPTEGLLDRDELAWFIRTMQTFGGHVSHRALNAVERQPYEVNISLIDALKGTVDGEDGFQVDRFVCAHAIMLALEGIPAIYVHSLLGTPNDHDRVERTGQPRAINRHQYELDALDALLDDPTTTNAIVLDRLRALITVRRRQRAFHPNATQFTMHLGPQVFAFWRQSIDRWQSIFALNNVSNRPVEVALSEINLVGTDDWHDLITGAPLDDRMGVLTLAPYQTVWLSNR